MKVLRITASMDLAKSPRIYHASSSEVFGTPAEVPQSETTAFRPATPYGCAKALATNMAGVYRQDHGLFVCKGILYNHESPRRGENFVTKKIAAGAAAHARGKAGCLELGNLGAERGLGLRAGIRASHDPHAQARNSR
jgi:GDPmannose 4,6-dehydratase